MEKLLAKIRNKRLKGNISLLVILILLASSVISLLSINQIQRLLTYGNMTFNYFRAFYLAKAGTELGLTEVYNSGDGFTYSISGDNSIIQNNLVGIYTGFNPYFKMSITGEFLYLTDDIRESNNCSDENKIKLATGAGIMLSLFSDKTNDLNKILSDKHSDKRLNPLLNFRNLSLYRLSGDSELTYAFFTYAKDEAGDEFMEDIIVSNGGTLQDFLKDKNIGSNNGYLTIKNSGNNSVEFCINMVDEPIPYSNFLVTVFGHYGDMEVGLQSIVKKGVPDWTLNVLWD